MKNEPAKTATIKLHGWQAEARRSSENIWTIDTMRNGAQWRLVQRVNSPGIFDLYNSAMKSLSETYRLNGGGFERVMAI